ncbi:nitrate reductase subunit alpha [Desulfomonile tiedjei]|uniref:nitrate reductase (quinone) n=1 Tax=Desulfomonile tiedjei (strain ATCC 49306 / DSM 6799 / DCB-1) TaxID=706587 RepID=I4C291_DESTA|nr:nitrate reductase subunit alpha [Desulfomonile tiedjei]AFM23682.1 respiratory nitrate reductase, alpha subunit [Desulfomonile tiedjei DSM 6799]
MSGSNLLSRLRWLRTRSSNTACKEEQIAENWAEIRCGQREWEDFYRRRWQFDKKVRSTHGVNCTGSCSWDVFVKDGIIVWEVQNVDYPGCGPDSPDHEPRGCPRGATYSWYTYSPVRVKYPYIRSNLLEMWREALKNSGDPVAAWQSIVEDPLKRQAYQKARGKGGFVRVARDEAITLISASLIHTIKKYGPDRIFGFSPIPAMSMVAHASGARFMGLLGGAMVSFYDWYCDLPPSSPQMWGEQTDVPESADWYESTYIIVWGTNIPMTRTPDAHFFVEARYRGAKVVGIAPDYSEYIKFSDMWLPARAGTDSALAMAMTFVVLKEFYIDRQSEYFTSYAKQYTDLPFAVTLKRHGDHYVSDRFMRASDLSLDVNNADWKIVYFDENSNSFVVPNGSIGFRWNEQGSWNLNPIDSITGAKVNPVLSFAEIGDEWATVAFPFFELESSRVKFGTVPVKRITVKDEEILVTTVFDLMIANIGIDRGKGGDVSKTYDDPNPCTPAWQETITGVAREDAIRVAREFAENAEKTRGKSMIIMGAGTNHWFHCDMNYRAMLNLTRLCGCEGVNGGGWAHYVGQEKVRPLAGWSTLAFALDWRRPPRWQNGTSFFYFASGQWRYDTLDARKIASPLAPEDLPSHPADYNVIAARLGWLPAYPQFNVNSLSLCSEAEDKGAKSNEEIVQSVVDKLKSGEIEFAIQDPDRPENFPRNLFLWRSNLLGSSGKGHEYFLKHLLGTHNAVLGPESPLRPREAEWREPAPEGKLDLLVTLDFRMSTSALYSDVVLPASSWYEIHDLSTTDMHPFIHPFNPAIESPWEAKSDWFHFCAIAEKFSELAAVHLGSRKDLVATPLFHDSPGEIAQPEVRDWLKGEVEPIPGKTMPNLAVVVRDYPNLHKMMTSVGPLVEEETIGAKGVLWKAKEEYAELKRRLGTVKRPGISFGRPQLSTNLEVAEAILTLAPETNGDVAVKSWSGVEELTGLSLKHMSSSRQGEKLTFHDITKQPRKIITSPTWSGIESMERPYSSFVINKEQRIPFRTLTGRAHFYLDHKWMLMFGDSLPIFRPPLNMEAMGSTKVEKGKGKTIVLNYLTPHSKWSIHTTYAETLIMMTLFRGGLHVWINNEDADSIDIRDNDWIEAFNINGVVTARAVVSHRIPRGKAFMYHAQERLITPVSNISNLRGGTHNSVTRVLVKPTMMIGGYGQLSYGFNYYGPTGSQRDEVIIVRKAGEVNWHED